MHGHVHKSVLFSSTLQYFQVYDIYLCKDKLRAHVQALFRALAGPLNFDDDNLTNMPAAGTRTTRRRRWGRSSMINCGRMCRMWSEHVWVQKHAFVVIDFMFCWYIFD